MDISGKPEVLFKWKFRLLRTELLTKLHCYHLLAILLHTNTINWRALTVTGEMGIRTQWTTNGHWIYCSCWSWVGFSITVEFGLNYFVYLSIFLGSEGVGQDNTLVSWHAHGGQRSSWKSQSMPSTTRAPEIKVRLSSLVASAFTCWNSHLGSRGNFWNSKSIQSIRVM